MMQQGQQIQWFHTYGPVKSDNNNKQLRYAFNAAGIALDNTITTKAYRAVSDEKERIVFVEGDQGDRGSPVYLCSCPLMRRYLSVCPKGDKKNTRVIPKVSRPIPA